MIELLIEKVIYASRGFLAPVYLALSLALLALSIKFFQEFAHFLPHSLALNSQDLILKILCFIDLTLAGRLIIMVISSGYENFVAPLDFGENPEKLGWLGTHAYASLKRKVATSIVAISSIHLTFVVSALCMGYLDKMTNTH